MSEAPNYLADVREQYETLPYPPRNPENEKHTLNAVYGEYLEYINHHAHNGRIDLSEFNVLVAGGGTGDATIFMAEQLLGTGNKVIQLDISEASLSIAKERVRIRGLDNVEFIHGSILDLPTMDIGPFQHINCSGVLHHLEDPDAGLAALASVLDEERGVINLMVYATYGRTWVYHAQELLRRINAGIETISERIDITKQLIQDASVYPWMQDLKRALLDNEIAKMGDQGLYDLLLHSQDRSYTMPELYDYVESAGLHLGHWVRTEAPYKHYISTHLVRQPELKARIESIPIREQEAIMEMINGQFPKHSCFASKNPIKQASPDDESLVVNLSVNAEYEWRTLHNRLTQLKDGEGLTFRDKITKREMTILINPVSRSFLMGIDNKTPIATIIDKAFEAGKSAGFPNYTREKSKADFTKVFQALDQLDWVVLRHPDVQRFPREQTLQQRVIEMYQPQEAVS